MIGKYLAVKYEYALPVVNKAVLPPADASLSDREIRTALLKMPYGWQQQLYRASIAGDDEIALRLVEQMPIFSMAVWTRLFNLICKFRLETIILWRESVSS